MSCCYLVFFLGGFAYDMFYACDSSASVSDRRVHVCLARYPRKDPWKHAPTRHLHQKLHRRRRKVLQHRRRRKVLQHRAARALCARRSTRCSLGVTSARSSRPLGGSTQSQLASRGSRLARRECQRHHRHHRLRHLHQTLHRWRSKVLQHPLRHLHQKLHRRRRTIAKTCLCR